MKTTARGRHRIAAVSILLVVGALGAGCKFYGIAAQQAKGAAAMQVVGTLDTTAPEKGPMIAVLVHWPEDGSDASVVDHFVVREPGAFRFITTQPGTYSVAAFLDLDRDLVYDPSEPGRGTEPATTFELAAGQSRTDLRIVIDASNRAPVSGRMDVRQLTKAAGWNRVGTTMGQLSAQGEVTTLDDPRFDRAQADKGLWKPFDFLLEVGGGVYFLEPYDPGGSPCCSSTESEGRPRSSPTWRARSTWSASSLGSSTTRVGPNCARLRST